MRSISGLEKHSKDKEIIMENQKVEFLIDWFDILGNQRTSEALARRLCQVAADIQDEFGELLAKFLNKQVEKIEDKKC